ncbi:hypothetical protein T069G_01935 [Trichoderma breve]|uniref:Uncharacterized protein n=1 Tax=Trichoderma breve TaxID=2034170 RepID=A0A9W9EEU9_9HYPO|nr:hypothetical protein T069G_01935 [Trichoderma breve]KAJ4865405.1 hypothetical protein T069G_01935 [Trichoderma breve]
MEPRLCAKPQHACQMQRSSTQLNGPGQMPKPNVQQPTWTRGSSTTKYQGHGTHDGETIFRLRIPCLKALDTSPEILKELRKVAPKFPNDLLTDEGLLHAHLVWYDFIQAPELNQERFIEEARKGTRRDSVAWTVPVADLVECILAWPHYLRWTAWSTIIFFSINADDLGPLERARDGERGSGRANPGCRLNESFLGDQASGTILVGKDQLLAKSFLWWTVILPRITPDDVRQLTFSAAIVHKSYVALILSGPHLA